MPSIAAGCRASSQVSQAGDDTFRRDLLSISKTTNSLMLVGRLWVCPSLMSPLPTLDYSGNACDYSRNLNDRAEFLVDDLPSSDTLHEAPKLLVGMHAKDEPTFACWPPLGLPISDVALAESGCAAARPRRVLILLGLV